MKKLVFVIISIILTNTTNAQSLESGILNFIQNNPQSRAERVFKKLGILTPSIQNLLFEYKVRRFARDLERMGYRPEIFSTFETQVKQAIADYTTGNYDLVYIDVKAGTNNIASMVIRQKINFEYVKRRGKIEEKTYETVENGKTIKHKDQYFSGIVNWYDVKEGVHGYREQNGEYHIFTVKLFPKRK